MIVLMSMVVLVMLSTSFVQLGRGSFFSIRQYEARAVALRACESGLDYARGRLARDLYWGRSPLGASRTVLEIPGFLEAEESGSSETDNLVQGTLSSSGASFRLQILNNIPGISRLEPPPWSRSGCHVPPRCALIVIEASYQGATRRVEALLTRRTITGGSVQAGEKFAATVSSFEEDALRFGSITPQGNQIKADGDIYLPRADRVKSETRGGRGRIRSGSDVLINSQVNFSPTGNASLVNGLSLKDDPVARADASVQMQASISTEAPVSPPRFDPQDLKSPSESSHPHTLPAGHYHFVGPNRVRMPDGTYAENNHPADNPAVVFSNYRLLPLENVVVHGDLSISGEITVVPAPGEDPIVTEFPVSLGIGYNEHGFLERGELAHKHRLTVEGNLKVEGDLIGGGQLFLRATGGSSGDLEVVGNSLMSATRTDGVAVVVDGNVKFLEDPTGLAETTPFRMEFMDFELFRQAIIEMKNLGGGFAETLNDWREAPVIDKTGLLGPTDEAGASPTTMRSIPLSIPATDYESLVFNQMLESGLTKSGNPFWSQAFDDFPGSPTGQELVASVMNLSGGYTLAKHIRLREFIKSVDRGLPNPQLILNDGDFFTGGPEVDATVLGLIANQVSAYFQDARLEGKTLVNFMETSPNPYVAGVRQDTIFGGLLYSKGNFFAQLPGKFKLLGSLITERSVSLKDVHKVHLVFDPASFEDHFDPARLGLGVAFYWTDH